MLGFRLLPVIAAVFWLLGTESTRALVTITAYEQNGDVIIFGAGSLSLNGLSSVGSGLNLGSNALIDPSQSFIQFGLSNVDLYSGLVPVPANFGSGGLSVPTFKTGNFGFDSFGFLVLPHGFHDGFVIPDDPFDPFDHPISVPGSVLTASMTFTNATLLSLGLMPGTYTWGGQIQLSVLAPNPVPLPASLPLFATILVGGGWLARRRRKQAAA